MNNPQSAPSKSKAQHHRMLAAGQFLQPLTDNEPPMANDEIKRMLFEAAQSLPKGYCIVPQEPTAAMWGGLARDIVMWDRFPKHGGSDLYGHLRSIGRAIPDWLLAEIPDTDQVPPKGTVAACIYKAMLDAYRLNH